MPSLAAFSTLRVIEIGTAVSVPLVGAVLRDLGAEVIKVESRNKLDANRARVPRRRTTSSADLDTQEAFYLLHELNRGKKSVTLNLKHERGKALFVDLLRRSDVFIENYAPGWLDRLGLGFDALREVNPRLIILAATAYGSEGPLKDQRGYAPVMSALAGLEGLIGYEDGEVMGFVSTAFSDPNAAYFGVLAVMSALLHRERTGRGSVIDLSQTEAAASLLGVPMVEFQLTGRVPGPRGNRHPVHVPHGVYPCKGEDSWVSLSVRSKQEWIALREVIGAPSWLWDTRLETVSGRRNREADLDKAISAWTRMRPAIEAADLLQGRGVSCTPLLTVDEVERAAHFHARQLTQTVHHATLGSMQVTTTPWHVDGDVMPVAGPGPMLGADNVEVFRSLCGLDEETYAVYSREGVFY